MEKWFTSGFPEAKELAYLKWAAHKSPLEKGGSFIVHFFHPRVLPVQALHRPFRFLRKGEQKIWVS